MQSWGNLEVFLKIVDIEYGSQAEVLRIGRLEQLTLFKRKTPWDIRTFWRKYRQVRKYAKNAGIVLAEDIMFTQSLRALDLNASQKHMISSALESHSGGRTAQ